MRTPRPGTADAPAARRSVYEDRPFVVAADDDWRVEKLREAGIPCGWRSLDEFLRSRW